MKGAKLLALVGFLQWRRRKEMALWVGVADVQKIKIKGGKMGDCGDVVEKKNEGEIAFG